MTFNGRGPRDRNFFVRVVLPECFHSHFWIVFAVFLIRLRIRRVSGSVSVIATVGPLCTPIAKIPGINIKSVMGYF